MVSLSKRVDTQVLQGNPELLDPVDFANIRGLTAKLHEKISSGTYDSPSWDLIRTAKLASRIYAPLGTLMSLGDHVRLSRSFLELFKAPQDYLPVGNEAEVQELRKLQADLKVSSLCLARWFSKT